MFSPFIHRVLSVILIVAVSNLAAQTNDNLANKKELEIQVLATISGSERKAKRMHRTIELKRAHQKRALEKMAERDDGRPYTGGIRTRLAYSNMLRPYTPNEVRVITKLTVGMLDINEYLNTVEAGDTYVPPYIEELVVIGSIFDHMPMDPAEFSVEDIKQMRTERRGANQLYRDGHYDAAYPILLDLAKRGFKDSQSRLAYILLNGTESIQKSNLRALGWLGSAAYGDTEPQFRVLFKRYMDEVPDYVRPTVDKIVDGYQQSFAHDEHQNCSTDHNYTDGSRIKKTFCRFKLEAIAEACELGLGGGKCWAHAVNQRD
ncbi:MAG: hypothetical protein OXG25_13020 [Gammaproteobacteria bacterium]|nr:hypothetical protein [Gammaproteobacteria bacterium]